LEAFMKRGTGSVFGRTGGCGFAVNRPAVSLASAPLEGENDLSEGRI